jgi:phospholipid/cholesterol/gamma-HCH transport system ATP-binding protein
MLRGNGDRMIELRDVVMKFGSTTLLENINLTIADGETLVLIGPSGQGKSVLLKLMGGVLIPTAGEIRINGTNLVTARGKERDELLRHMGMLFQKNALFDSLTCSENIGFPLRETTKLNDAEIEKKISFFLEAVGISHARDLYPDEISGGMQKRLGIARALALNPKIIFYDDPTAGLDPITSRTIVQLIIKLREESGSTVVAITNDMNRAFQMADRIALVSETGIVMTGTPEQTKKHSDPRVRQFIHGLLEGPLTAHA